jgi:hypothetical protein
LLLQTLNFHALSANYAIYIALKTRDLRIALGDGLREPRDLRIALRHHMV